MDYNQNDPVFEIDNTSKRARNSVRPEVKVNSNIRPAANNARPVSRKRAVVAKKDEKSGVSRAVGVLWSQGIVPMIHAKNDVRVKTVRAEKKKPFPVSALFMSLVCTVLFMFMIVSYVQINEYTLEVSNLRTDLADMISQDKELTTALEKKNDMLTIEEMAAEFGMVKADQLTKKHIALTNEDKIEVVEPEPTEDETVVTTVMSGLWENFAGLREYLG
ncbi:MAG: hypothetical protein IJC50_02355 [Clostridia bacterium]|nr:hypothetical protein [Clostridia bacterium]